MIIIFAVLILLLLAWAPWLDNDAIHDRILAEKGRVDRSIDPQTGELLCDYSVMWFPFGRWVASCEAGYFVLFYGQVLP